MATQTQQNQQMLSDANPNTRLHRLKKPDLVQICLHYGVSSIGTKPVLTERIIQARDDHFQANYTTPSIYEINQVAEKYRILRVSGISFSQYHRHHILERSRYHVDTKINLIILYFILQKMKDQTYQQNHHQIFMQKHRNELRDDIKVLCNELASVTGGLPQRQRKKLTIQNLSDEAIYVYWSIMRDDYPEYSQCNLLVDILPGMTGDIYFFNDETKIIASKRNLGRSAYYMDIQERNNIVHEADAGSCNGRLEVKGEKGELEKWKEAALKADFLIKQLKRLGIEKNDNYNAVVDLHQDIVIPEHSERDKEIAGIPSTFTNVT